MERKHRINPYETHSKYAKRVIKEGGFPLPLPQWKAEVDRLNKEGRNEGELESKNDSSNKKVFTYTKYL